MKTKFLFFIVVLLCSGIVSAQTVGPKNGKLMIVGGGDANLLVKKFVEIAGGENARIVVIPNCRE